MDTLNKKTLQELLSVSKIMPGKITDSNTGVIENGLLKNPKQMTY